MVVHTLLGALLGALGAVVQLSIDARTWLQISAGLLIIILGLAQLGGAGFAQHCPRASGSWMTIVRNRARSRAAVAPALLGVATVLIPCGVTLSVEALALTSGLAVAGAATMAVFVLGTTVGLVGSAPNTSTVFIQDGKQVVSTATGRSRCPTALI